MKELECKVEILRSVEVPSIKKLREWFFKKLFNEDHPLKRQYLGWNRGGCFAKTVWDYLYKENILPIEKINTVSQDADQTIYYYKISTLSGETPLYRDDLTEQDLIPIFGGLGYACITYLEVVYLIYKYQEYQRYKSWDDHKYHKFFEFIEDEGGGFFLVKDYEGTWLPVESDLGALHKKNTKEDEEMEGEWLIRFVGGGKLLFGGDNCFHFMTRSKLNEGELVILINC